MSTTSTSGRPGRLTLARDIGSYLGGWVLIVYQMLLVPPGSVNEWFLLLGGSLIGVPGIGEILSLRARQNSGGTGTATSPTSPPAPDSSPQRQ